VSYKTDERESPQEALPARENSSLGFITLSRSSAVMNDATPLTPPSA